MSTSHRSAFKKIARFDGPVWLHKNKPVWIVKFDAIDYQVYRAVEGVPHGRAPWSVDNRRIGPKSGFSTLAAAMEAAKKPTTKVAEAAKEPRA